MSSNLPPLSGMVLEEELDRMHRMGIENFIRRTPLLFDSDHVSGHQLRHVRLSFGLLTKTSPGNQEWLEFVEAVADPPLKNTFSLVIADCEKDLLFRLLVVIGGNQAVSVIQLFYNLAQVYARPREVVFDDVVFSEDGNIVHLVAKRQAQDLYAYASHASAIFSHHGGKVFAQEYFFLPIVRIRRYNKNETTVRPRAAQRLVDAVETLRDSVRVSPLRFSTRSFWCGPKPLKVCSV